MATSKPDKRKIGIVRTYLNALRDDPEDRRNPHTVQAVAKEHGISVRDLRAFRDGNDQSLPPIVLNTWVKLLGTDGTVTGFPAEISPIERDWYNQTILAQSAGGRLERYSQYETIDTTRPEAASALDAWADIVCTGGVGDEGRRRHAFEPEVEGDGKRLKKAMADIADKINTHILPDEQKLMVVRDMAKYGDQFEQVGLHRQDNGSLGLARLVNMPVKTLWVKQQQDGSVDPADTYAQILPSLQNKLVASWPLWKVVQFSNRKSRADLYGRSIFESCLRAYIQLEAMEAAMVIRRLERAPLRMKHVLDVGHLASEQEIQKAKGEYRKANRKVRTVDGNKNFQMQRINMPADEDFIVAKRDKDSPADVAPIEGDANIGITADFDHFFNKWLSGLGPPKAHLGYEADTMRSVVTDLHIVFARKGRRMQMQFIRGLNHLYWIEMILRGIDPRAVRYTIIPPALGTRDELIRAQVMVAHANTVQFLAKAFASTGRVPSIQWFLKYMMNLDEPTIDALELTDVIQQAAAGSSSGMGAGKEPNAGEAVEMAVAALGSPEIVAEVNRTSFLINERAIGLKKPEIMGLSWPLAENPFGCHFEDVVRSLGVKELKSVLE
ncbi:MAG: portal protein [Bacillota bacterium]